MRKRRNRGRKQTYNRRARIIAFLGSKEYVSAPEVYRITLPHSTLTDNSGMSAGWMMADNVIATLSQTGAALQKGLAETFAYDIIVLRRLLTGEQEAGAGLCRDLRLFSKQYGGKEAVIVYESDDDYSGRYRPADVVPGITWKPYLEHVDAVMASTKPLAALMAEEAGGKPSFVTPNCLAYDWFKEASLAAERENTDRLNIMLAGTGTHDEDWKPVAEVMPKIQEDYGYDKVGFLVGGFVPDYLYGKCEHLPAVHYSAYPGMLRQADILCCALDPNDKFNESKSNIKAVEGWSAARPIGKHRQGGCAVIASRCTSYRRTVLHRHNGLQIEHTPEAWDKALRWLIEDHVTRRKLQVNGLQAAKRQDIAQGWANWYKAYSSILDL